MFYHDKPIHSCPINRYYKCSGCHMHREVGCPHGHWPAPHPHHPYHPDPLLHGLLARIADLEARVKKLEEEKE